MIDIAIMGHGVVGSGVAEVLFSNREHIAEEIRDEINIKYILDIRDFSSLPYADKFTKDFTKILNDGSVRIVVETMGGINPSYDYVKRCLSAGKSVVSSNKELVAEKGAELLAVAEKNNVNFLFEASVGGGIPVLRPMAQCLAANRISEITGILNGTTNFIITRMIKDGMSFDGALELAQRNGYAERDPSADIDGADACRKICILASLAFGRHVYPRQVRTEGIRGVTLEDIKTAAAFGRAVKLVGHAKRAEGGIYASVFPALLPDGNPLSHIDGVYNGILIHGDFVGDVMFYGRGAGKEPTASAVAADVMDCALHLNRRKYIGWGEGCDGYVRPPAGETVRLFARASASDAANALDEAREVLGEIETPGSAPPDSRGEIAFITGPAREGELREKLAKLKKSEIHAVMRVI